MVQYELYDRDFSLQIADKLLLMYSLDISTQKEFSPFTVSFTVERSGKKDPNKASIEVINLDPDTRSKVTKGAPVILEAGYLNHRAIIFSGQITHPYSRHDGNKWVTSIECGDGEVEFRSSFLNVTLGNNTKPMDIVKEAAKELGVGLGNLPEKYFRVPPRDVLTRFKDGITLTGKTVDVLEEYLKTMGYEWSIQDGILQILAPDETTFEDVIVLDSANIVGSPEMGDKGSVRVQTLLQPGANPGRRVLLQSPAVQGMLKIKNVRHVGASTSNEWYTDIEGKLLESNSLTDQSRSRSAPGR